VAAGDSGRDLGDVADLVGQVGRHEVDVVGEVLPGAADTLHLRLTAEATLGTHLSSDSGDLVGERRQLVHHGVDRVLELEDLALDVDRDLLTEVAVGHRSRHLGDASHLIRQVRRHEVDVVGEVLPGPGHAFDSSLTAELSFRTHFPRDSGDLVGDRRERVGHGVDGLREGGDLALGLDGDLLGQVAAGNSGRDLGDVADLVGEVGRHEVDVVGEVLPGPGHAFDSSLTAELSFRSHLACDSGDFVGERGQGVGHAVDGLGQGGDLTLGLDGDLLAQVAGGDRGRHVRDVADLAGEVARHEVHRVGEVLPRAGHAFDLGLAAEDPLGAHLACDSGDLVGEGAERVGHAVDGLGQGGNFALRLDGDLLGQVAAGDSGGHLGDVADLAGEVRREEVDVVGEVLPRPGHTFDLCLPAELSFGADLTGDSGYLRRERRERVGHAVDGLGQRGNFALGFNGDLLGEVAGGDGGRDLGDVADLIGQVGRHEIDVVGEVLPRTTDAPDLGLTTELAFGAYLSRDSGHLVRERRQLVHHRVDGVLQLEDLALDVDGDLLAEVTLGDGGGDLGDVADLAREVGGHVVHRVGEVLPRAAHALHARLTASANDESWSTMEFTAVPIRRNSPLTG